MKPLRPALIALATLAISSSAAWSQIPGAELTQVQATREALQNLLQQLEQASNSGSYSGELRARARQQAAQVQRRLQDGDFQVGDRIFLQVERETTLTDTFLVRPGRMLQLPGIGDVPLHGVLRAEISGHLTTEIARFVRDPVVRAQALVRVTITGGVGRQGFYTVPVDALLTDVLTQAGGPSAAAQLDRIEIQRGGEVLFSGSEVERAITLGLTLDALGVQAGDRIVVTELRPRDPLRTVQVLTFLLTVPLTIASLIALFQ